MKICNECKHYREQTNYTPGGSTHRCFNVQNRMKHEDPITGYPGYVFCFKVNKQGDCKHWKMPEPARRMQTPFGTAREAGRALRKLIRR